MKVSDRAHVQTLYKRSAVVPGIQLERCEAHVGARTDAHK